jgi:alpha-beta hydrolase superfamily lysophospholipase
MPSPLADRRASTREATGFRLALAVIAVAVLDDAFLHPEPATPLAQRAVSGLAPLAVAVTLAWAYPRLRAGARAAVALVCGVPAVVAGIADGARHVAVDRVAGDDLTAILAAVAGVALIVDAVARLWRTRRAEGHRYLRRAATGVAAALVGFLVVLPVAIAIVATHKARSPVPAGLGTPVTLRTADGLRLSAAYEPSRNGAAVIVFPGRTGTQRHARLLARHGYGVLLLDRRGEGGSEGTLNLFGWNGENDVRAALDFLGTRSDVQRGRIGALGLSVGGELLLQTAAGDRRLRAVVSEGAGVRSLAEHLDTPGLGRVQRWGSNWVVQTAAVAVLSGTLPPPDLTEQARRIGPRPVLLIRARDGNADEVLNQVYARHIGASAELWTVRGGHTGALSSDPSAYERRVIAFFDGALQPASTP